METIDDINDIDVDAYTINDPIDNNDVNMYTIDNPINKAKHLLTLLSPTRITKNKKWTNIGYALYNISPTLYNNYVTYSKQNP